jgi:hypothetical protein
MSYHRGMASAASATKANPVPPKTLDAEDASALALLAYRVVLHDNAIDRAEALRQLGSVSAKEVGRAVLGSTKVGPDALDLAERLKEWARRSAGLVDSAANAK